MTTARWARPSTTSAWWSKASMWWAGGLMVLPRSPEFEPGRAFANAMGIERDVVFDLAIETNRPDAMCVAGVARDAAARLRLPFAIPGPNPVDASPDPRLVRVESLD